MHSQPFAATHIMQTKQDHREEPVLLRALKIMLHAKLRLSVCVCVLASKKDMHVEGRRGNLGLLSAETISHAFGCIEFLFFI